MTVPASLGVKDRLPISGARDVSWTAPPAAADDHDIANLPIRVEGQPWRLTEQDGP
ncbi:hypothetical protein OG379_38485 [Streptomyces sp. NBC_01166]|uniref:hypothetical protein n=1 Tax=Streptomyces sp. NBC_01166 TaxID=2903755 RepID=UPI0038662B66|nr:hypothetical protein OG379_38485 [Streptomyces sp. NBC_01166]